VNEHVLRLRIAELAADVGRLRRRFASNENGWTSAYIADRMAGHVEALHCLATPSAAELVAWTAPGDEDAIDEAIQIVDERWRRLRSLLHREAA
jgi:hypothetical protein